MVELFIHREVKPRQLLKIGTEAVILSSVILMVLVSSLALTSFFKDKKVADYATDRMRYDQVTVRHELLSDAEYDMVDAPVFALADLPGGGVKVRPFDASKPEREFTPEEIGARKPVKTQVVGLWRESGDDVVLDVKDPTDWDGATQIRVPKAAVIDRIEPLVHSRLGFLIVVNILLLVVGSVMDIYSGIVVIAPLIVPMAVAYDVNLVHLGIIFVLNLELGLAHPPLGINLFIATSYFRKSILEVTIAAIPYLILLLGVLAAVTYWEPLSLWLVEAGKAKGP